MKYLLNRTQKAKYLKENTDNFHSIKISDFSWKRVLQTKLREKQQIRRETQTVILWLTRQLAMHLS